jgi:heme exporter protein CcmD
MNHLPFIVGAYAITAVATIALIAASYRSMRKAEAEADALRGDK